DTRRRSEQALRDQTTSPGDCDTACRRRNLGVRFLRRRGELWHNSHFLLFWAGESISFVGSEVTRLALPLTAVLILHATPAQMGILTALGTLPFLFVGLM